MRSLFSQHGLGDYSSHARSCEDECFCPADAVFAAGHLDLLKEPRLDLLITGM